MIGRRWIVAIVFLAMVGVPGEAHALLTAEEKQALVQDTYARGASSELPGLNCTGTCSDMAKAQQRAYPNTQASRNVLGDLRRLRTRAGTLPKLAGRVTLVGTAGYVGWKIGTGIRRSFVGTSVGVSRPDMGEDGFRREGPTTDLGASGRATRTG